VYEELLKPIYSPTDTVNNASDDLSNLSISK
jgi:hypothetical protein